LRRTKQQSAVGHAITMNYPLRAVPFSKDGEFFGYAVEGTPADAVKLGVRFLVRDRKPDLLISGINHGSNTAINIIYSGTVIGGHRGDDSRIPSIAVLADDVRGGGLLVCREDCPQARADGCGTGLPEGTLLNVNVRAAGGRDPRGEDHEAGASPRGTTRLTWRRIPRPEYFWLKGRLNVIDTDPEADQVAVQNRYVSVTRFIYDLTDRRTQEPCGGGE